MGGVCLVDCVLWPLQFAGKRARHRVTDTDWFKGQQKSAEDKSKGT